MFRNKSEAHERVINAIEDIKACCEVDDHYNQWSDIAASSIQAFLEELTPEQTDDTCSAFLEYIEETRDENPNLANGIKDALMICLNEMKDYVSGSPVPYLSEDTEDDETAELIEIYDSYISKTENLKV